MKRTAFLFIITLIFLKCSLGQNKISNPPFSHEKTDSIDFKGKGLCFSIGLNQNSGLGISENKYSYNEKSFATYGFCAGIGYLFNSHFSLGISAGVQSSKIDNFVNRTLYPVFLNIKYNYLEGEISPVFSLNTGTSIAYKYGIDGYFFNPTMGIKKYFSNKKAILLNLGYKWQTRELVYYPNNKVVTAQYITISTGLSF